MVTKKTSGTASAKARPLSPARALAVLLDPAHADGARKRALAQLGLNVLASKETFRKVLDLLLDTGTDAALRSDAVSLLQAATFDSTAFAPYRTMYMAALRRLRRDADANIRQRAFGILARESDADTQKLLVDGLKNPAEALLAPEKALQLLGYDAHAGAYEVARQIAATPPNPLARREALRVLAADAQSAELFEQVLRDKSEDHQLRQLAASSLNLVAPERLQRAARDMAVDAAENDDIRSMSLTALSNFGDAEALARDAPLQAQVDSLDQDATPSNPSLAAATAMFKLKRR